MTDSRDEVDTGSIPGARHYWDDDWATGRWLAEKDLGGYGYQGAVYDVYYLFGPDATWDDVPGPIAAAAQPVSSGTAELEAALAEP